MDLVQEVMNWVIVLRLQGPNKSTTKGMKRGPVKGRSHDASSRYCSNYPRNLLLPLSFLWFVSLAVGPCPWLFLIGLHKSRVLCSRRGRVLPFQLSADLALSYSINGEGNGNPLQCSSLEKSRDGGAWWAVVYGVTQSRTRLKRLSSSSSSSAHGTYTNIDHILDHKTRFSTFKRISIM